MTTVCSSINKTDFILTILNFIIEKCASNNGVFSMHFLKKISHLFVEINVVVVADHKFVNVSMQYILQSFILF